MDNDEQRDYAEEAYNRRLLTEHDEDALVPGEIEICTDCLFILANGEGPDDVAARLAERWPPGTITLGRITGEDDSGPFFSTHACDGCTNSHAGDRYYATGWAEA